MHRGGPRGEGKKEGFCPSSHGMPRLRCGQQRPWLGETGDRVNGDDATGTVNPVEKHPSNSCRLIPSTLYMIMGGSSFSSQL